MPKQERTYVMVKPDGVQRGLVGSIVKRFEEKGLKLVGIKMIQIDEDLASKHYGEHKDKPFFGELISFITSSPVVATVWEGLDAIDVVRTMMGKTNPKEAAPGTIRGDYAIYMGNNIVHGSDSQESAAKEIGLFFDERELISYDLALDKWING